MIVALKDEEHTDQNIYTTYIDFYKAFTSIDHVGLLDIMEDLGFPFNNIKIVGNMNAIPQPCSTVATLATPPPPYMLS